MVMRMNDAMLSSIPSRVLQGGVCTDEIIVSDCQSAVIDLATIDSRMLHIHQQIRVRTVPSINRLPFNFIISRSLLQFKKKY